MKKHKQKSSSPKKSGQFLYGFHAVAEAWLNPERNVYALYVTDQSQKGFEYILKQSGKLNRPAPRIVNKHDLDSMLPKGAVHQGLALDAAPLPEQNLQDIIIQAAEKPHSLVLILDQITDPHNVGAILRSACVFGCDGIVMQRKHAPDLDGVLTKTASGGAEHVPVAYETNLSRAIEDLQGQGYFVFGLDERGEQTITQLAQNNPPEKIALVLGAEGPGIRQLVKTHCDSLVKLPTFGPISSLNVSNAAAVSLYALSTSESK